MAQSRKTTKVTRTTRKKSAKKSTSRAPASKKSGTKSAKKTSKKKKKTVSRSKKKVATRASSARKSAPKKKSASKKAAGKSASKKTTTKKSAASKKKSKRVAPTVVSKKKKSKATKSSGGGASKSVLRKKPRSVAEVAAAAQMDDKGYVFINGRRVRMISTQGLPVPKKRAAVAEVAPEEDTGPTKPLKTRLSKKELNHYRTLLLIKRAEIVGDLTAMEASALRSSGGDISHMPIHMADIGTDTYDQDFTLGMAETERKQIREIDDAIQRIDDKTYGVCHMTGKDIPKARLDAKPWAKYTIEAARIVESQMQR